MHMLSTCIQYTNYRSGILVYKFKKKNSIVLSFLLAEYLFELYSKLSSGADYQNRVSDTLGSRIAFIISG